MRVPNFFPRNKAMGFKLRSLGRKAESVLFEKIILRGHCWYEVRASCLKEHGSDHTTSFPSAHKKLYEDTEEALMVIPSTYQTRLPSTIPAWLIGNTQAQDCFSHRMGCSLACYTFCLSCPFSNVIPILALSFLSWSWYYVVCSIRKRSWQREQKKESLPTWDILQHTVVIL